MEKNAVIISGDDLRFLIREAIRTELNIISRTTQPTPVPQEGGIEFAMGVLRVYAKSTIYKLTSEGKIPHTRRGKTLWFNRSDLEKWLADGASLKKITHPGRGAV